MDPSLILDKSTMSSTPDDFNALLCQWYCIGVHTNRQRKIIRKLHYTVILLLDITRKTTTTKNTNADFKKKSSQQLKEKQVSITVWLLTLPAMAARLPLGCTPLSWSFYQKQLFTIVPFNNLSKWPSRHSCSPTLYQNELAISNYTCTEL